MTITLNRTLILRILLAILILGTAWTLYGTAYYQGYKAGSRDQQAQATHSPTQDPVQVICRGNGDFWDPRSNTCVKTS